MARRRRRPLPDHQRQFGVGGDAGADLQPASSISHVVSPTRQRTGTSTIHDDVGINLAHLALTALSQQPAPCAFCASRNVELPADGHSVNVRIAGQRLWQYLDASMPKPTSANSPTQKVARSRAMRTRLQTRAAASTPTCG
jgi:hypothetical protein